MENERNHKEKYPFETFLKDREKSTRELALDWWGNLDSAFKVKYAFQHNREKGLPLIRRWGDLTGREIEEIWKAETQPNFNAVDRNEDRSAAFGFGTGKPNQKQFKEGNDALFKAYINKFSQEYKARMLQILIDDLGVRALVDESLRSK
jgi:hypothetical protein